MPPDEFARFVVEEGKAAQEIARRVTAGGAKKP